MIASIIAGIIVISLLTISYELKLSEKEMEFRVHTENFLEKYKALYAVTKQCLPEEEIDHLFTMELQKLNKQEDDEDGESN